MTLAAGRYLGKVKSWGFREIGEKKTLQFSVAIDVQGETYYWNAWPESENPKAQEIMVKALRTMGFSGNSLADLAGKDVLDREKEINVTLEYEEGQDGKIYPRIKWVNEVGFQMSEDLEQRVKNLKHLNAAFMANPASTPSKSTLNSSSEIPF